MEIGAINGSDDITNDVIAKSYIELTSAEFMDELNEENTVWKKLENHEYKYPVFNWQEDIKLIGNIVEKTYNIYNQEDLIELSKMVYNGETCENMTIYLMNDIEIDEYIRAVGYMGFDEGFVFQGTFEGNNNKIYVTTPSFSGLFGFVGENAVIKDLILESEEEITVSTGIAGMNKGLIQNCINKINLKGRYTHGGISGTNYGTIKKCKNYGNISEASAVIGGIATGNYGTIEECINYGNISSQEVAGGIVGDNRGNGHIYNCINKGTITITENYAGGIAGGNTAKIRNCYNIGIIQGAEDSFGTGGIDAFCQGIIENCYNVGSVYGEYPGGITGATNGGFIYDSYYLETTATYSDGYDKGSKGKMTSEEMKKISFIQTLNSNLDEQSIKWILDSEDINSGYPVFITEGEYKLIKIEESTSPENTTYIEGQNFNPAGMVVTATYNDGSTKEVTDYTVIDGNNLPVGKTSVTISYTENGVTKTATQEITVIAKALTGIEITKAPNKTEYIEGQNFDKTGMVVTATYNDGSTKEVTNYTVTDGENLPVGKTSVTISYTENGVTKTATVEIKVTAIERYFRITKYEIKDNYIRKIAPKTLISDFIKNIQTNMSYIIKEGNKEVESTSIMKTGQTITVGDKTYTIIVIGDLNKDGKIDVSELARIAKIGAGKITEMTEIEKMVIDVDMDGEIKINDLAAISKYASQ